MSESGPIRASDSEREQAAEALREDYAAGRLDSEELDERLQGVYEAKTVAELRALRDDLPEPVITAQTRGAELAQRRAELRVRLLQRAGGAFTPFVICTFVWAASGAESDFWPVWLLIVPLAFIARNAWRLYGPAPELDRVHAELEHRGRGSSHRRARERRRGEPS